MEMNRSKKIKVLNTQTNESYILNNPMEVCIKLGYKYGSIMNWLHNRANNNKYKLEYIEE